MSLNSHTIVREDLTAVGPSKSAKHPALLVLVLTALIAGFVTPVMTSSVFTPAAQAAGLITPVIHKLFIGYATREEVPATAEGQAAFKDQFLEQDLLDALISQVSTYWNRETNGAIAKIIYDWDDVRPFQVPAKYPLFNNNNTTGEATSPDYDGLLEAQFPGVSLDTPGTHFVALVNAAEVAKEDPRVSPISLGGQGTKDGLGLSKSGVIRVKFGDPILSTFDPILLEPSLHSSWVSGWAKASAPNFAHEFGHNLGLDHAGSGTCPDPAYDGVFPDPCPLAYYGDTLDIMGRGRIDSHLSAYRKSQLGLLSSNNRVEIADAYSGTIALTAVENWDSTSKKEIRIIDPTDPSAVYSIEYRKNSPGVRVLRVFSPTLKVDGESEDTALLSPLPAPAGSDIRGSLMQAGNTFQSASGNVSFSVESIDGDQAMIKLNVTSVLSLSRTSSSVAPGGGYSIFTVTSDMSWKITTPDWIETTVSSGTGTRTVGYSSTANLTGQSRSGAITVTTSSGVSRWIDMTQAAVALDVIPSQWAAPATGGIQTVQVTSNTLWSVSIDPNGAKWLASDTSSSYNNKSIMLTAQANTTGASRTAVVTVKTNAGTSRTVTVNQPSQEVIKPQLEVNPTSWAAPAGGGSRVITVTSNTSWSVSSSSTLVTVTPASGVGNGTVTLTMPPNTSGMPRSAKVTFTTTRGVPQISREVTVTQPSQNYLNVSVNLSTPGFPAGGGTFSFTVSSNTTWTVSGMPDWVTPRVVTGGRLGQFTTTTVTLTAQPNSTGSSRLANVTVRTTSGTLLLSRGLVITQPSLTVVKPSLSISPSSLMILPSTGGNQVLNVTSNTSWTVSVDPATSTWLTPSVKSGTGNGSVILKAAPYTVRGGLRYVTVTVTTTGASPISQSLRVFQYCL